jgi:glucose/arabinose dehydrogenase
MGGPAVGLALRRRTRNDHGDPIRKEDPTPSAREAAWRAYVTHARRAAAVAAVMAGIAACGGGGGSSTTATGTAKTSATSTAGGATSGRAGPRPAVVASGLPFPTNLAFDRRGGLWVTSATAGRNPTDGVWYVPPGGRPQHVIKGLRTALGLLWVGDRLYVGHATTPTTGRVTMFEGFADGRFARHRTVLDGLAIGRNSVASIVRGTAGRLYVGVGSTGDNAGRPGRVVSFSPDGGASRLEATGLRNPYGLAFDGRRLLVTDSGRDDLGPSRPPDELNGFEPGGPAVDFGFPRCYDQGGRACAGNRSPLAALAPHASPDGVAVKGDSAFIAENGSSFVEKPTGSDIQRVDLRTGRPAIFWRSPIKRDPLGATIGPDGNLYVTLYASGKVVRFSL